MKISHDSHTAIIRIETWENVRKIGNSLKRWLFRGQSKSEWILKTKLSRSLESREIGIEHYTISELFILHEFQSVAHNFTSNIPDNDDLIGWLSLIQHHGGPTRLLDFTTSFYIAAFFALDQATENCAVWAINRPKLIEILPSLINRLDPSSNFIPEKMKKIYHDAIYLEVSNDLVLTATSSRIAERQFVQKGVAVVPLSINTGFIESILGSFNHTGSIVDENNLVENSFENISSILPDIKLLKIILTPDCFLDARLDLQEMNINYFTLFRGLDGLGKHLTDTLNRVEAFEGNTYAV